MKKLFALFLAALMLAGLLAACGAESFAENGAAMDMGGGTEMEAPGEGIYGSVSDSSTGSTQHKDQKLVKTVELRAETEDLDTLLKQLTDQIAALGGYTEYQNIYNGGAYNSYRSRSAELTIRVPADNLGSFLNNVEGISNVISKTESVDDVTLQYVDIESRLKALQTEHDRLVELMAQAENLADLLTIEQRLTDVRYELESVTSSLRILENQVSYATIELYIDEVEVYTEVEEPTVWERISTGFMNNLRDLGDFLVDLFVWIVTCSPQLLVFAGVIALIVWLCKLALRNRKPRKSPYTPITPPAVPPQDPEENT